MKTSESVKSISEAYVNFAADKPAIEKSYDVQMKGQSKSGKDYNVNYQYAPLEIIQAAVKPVLKKHGLAVTQFLGHVVLNDSLVCGITTRIVHSSGEFFQDFWPVNLESITKEQDRGSKLTFNKRYAYGAALDLELKEEDSDAVGVENEKPPAQAQASYTKQFYKQDMLPNPADFLIEFGKKYKGKKIGDVPNEDLDQTIEYFLNSAKDSRSLLTGKVRAFVVNAHDYLVTKGYYPPYES